MRVRSDIQGVGMPRPTISVVFTCKGRSELTELCLRRFKELMPQPYELIVAYDGWDANYLDTLTAAGHPDRIVVKDKGMSRFTLINEALDYASGELFMHLENDFYWVDESCLESALKALDKYHIDFIRFELLPFTINQFNRFEIVGDHDICWMKPETPYRWNLNPHIRTFKFPGGKSLKDGNFTEQPERHHGEGYNGTSCCMSGDNFRHLGIYDESGHFKEYYAERFFDKRGKRTAIKAELLDEFNQLTDNLLYRKLFLSYLDDNE